MVEREMTEQELEEFLNNAFEQEFAGDGGGSASVVPHVQLQARNFDANREMNADVDGTVESPHVEIQVSNSAFARRIREFDIVNFGYKVIKQFL